MSATGENFPFDVSNVAENSKWSFKNFWELVDQLESVFFEKIFYKIVKIPSGTKRIFWMADRLKLRLTL